MGEELLVQDMKPEMVEVTNSYCNWSTGVGFRGTEKHEDEGAKLNTSDDRHCEKKPNINKSKLNWVKKSVSDKEWWCILD